MYIISCVCICVCVCERESVCVRREERKKDKKRGQMMYIEKDQYTCCIKVYKGGEERERERGIKTSTYKIICMFDVLCRFVQKLLTFGGLISLFFFFLLQLTMHYYYFRMISLKTMICM